MLELVVDETLGEELGERVGMVVGNEGNILGLAVGITTLGDDVGLAVIGE